MGTTNHSNFKEKRCWSCRHFNCKTRKIENSFFGDYFVTDTRGICYERARNKTEEVSSEMYNCSKYERALDVELYLENKEKEKEMRMAEIRNRSNEELAAQSGNKYSKYSTNVNKKPVKTLTREESKKYLIIFGSIVGVIVLIFIIYSLSQCSLFVDDKNKLLNYIKENGSSETRIYANEYSGSDYVNFSIKYEKYSPEIVNNNEYEFIAEAGFYDDVQNERFDVNFYFNLNGSSYNDKGLSNAAVVVEYTSNFDYTRLTFDSINIDHSIILLSTLGDYTIEPIYQDEVSENFNETHVRALSEVYSRQLLGSTTSLFKKAGIGIY